MKIYIVDKDFQTLKTFEEIIKKYSKKIEASYYTSSSDLMKSIEDELPDTVIVDGDMNRGMVTASKVKKIDEKIKVVISSINRAKALETIQAGYNGYLLKPLKEEEVKKVLHR